MLEWFKCPDTQLINVTDCLNKGCRMSDRCLTLPTLHEIATERKWAGIASTTQLLNGTMYTFLKLTQPYVVDPDKMMFALHGTKVHKLLDESAKELNLISEVALTTDDRDIFDLLEPDNGGWILTDYKTWGSFRVAKCLGIIETGKKPDPTGAIYKRGGAWGKAGSPKMITVFQIMPTQADNWDTELQLNRYRVMLEERGLKVNKMRIQIVVRDGGLAVARSRGVERNSYLAHVKKLDNQEVSTYFAGKIQALENALHNNKWTIPCDNRECWDGVRCRDYCEVAQYCSKGLIEQGGK